MISSVRAKECTMAHRFTPKSPSKRRVFRCSITTQCVWRCVNIRKPTPIYALMLAMILVPVTSSPTSQSSTPATATTLRFGSQPSDRPLALYRAPAPYLEPGKRALNSVIITSKPIGITEQRDLMATTASPFTSSSTAASDASRVSIASAGGGDSSWRRFSSSSATTEQPPTLTLSLPQYSIDCAEGLTCSETIAVDASTPRPTFKPYPQDVLDKFLKELSAAAATRQENDRRAEASSPFRASNRLANLYLNEQEEDERSDERHADHGPLSSSEEGNGGGGEAEAGSEGKGRWHLLDAQEHRHPYDDPDGWVSLEPVPWSTSKVSKWHARPKPNRWDSRPSSDWDKPARPHWARPSYSSSDDAYDNRPQRPSSLWPNTPSRPSYWHSENKPSASPWVKPQEYDYQKPSTSSLHWASVSAGSQDIITDNRPDRWPEHHSPSNSGHRPWDNSHHHGSSSISKPHYDYSYQNYPNKRPSSSASDGGYEYYGGSHDSHRHPATHPDESEGQWVLVSSTKGYAMPHRHKIFQRALAISAKPISSRRTVRLTVLPAHNGTANTTISHGGLLEVESTFQSVEEEQQKQQEHQQQQVFSHQVHVQNDNSIPTVQAVKPKTGPITLLAHRAPQDNSRAVLAAVGAGMVPATIALMAPLVLGRRKRRSPATDDNRVQQNLIDAFKQSALNRRNN